jgi:hypothetical protein
MRLHTEQTSRRDLGLDLDLHLLLALKILTHQVRQAGAVDGARPALQADRFEQAAHARRDACVRVEIFKLGVTGREACFDPFAFDD